MHVHEIIGACAHILWTPTGETLTLSVQNTEKSQVNTPPR